MFKKILVPLDGSKLAECALIYVETLAKNCNALEVVLVSVTEKIKGITSNLEVREVLTSSDKAGVEEFRGDISGVNRMDSISVNQVIPYASNINLTSGTTITFGKMEKQALKYLHRIEKQLSAKGMPIKSVVLMGSPAEQITKYAEDEGIDVIVMSSHGRSGPSRWALGSVSDKVFRATCIPILMIRAPGCYPGV